MKIGVNAAFLNEKPTGVGIFTKEVSDRLHILQKNTVVFTSVALNAVVKKTPAYLRGSIHLSHNLGRFVYMNTVFPIAVKQSAVDVLFCPIMEFPFVTATPLVVTVHDLHPCYFPRQFGLASIHFKLSLMLLPSLARRVVVPSNFVKEELMKTGNLHSEVIDVVYEGYNAELFKPFGTDKKQEFLDRYGIEGPYVLFVGSLFPYKNVKTLVKSFLKIKGSIPHLLVIIGKKEVSREQPCEDERILYLDYVDSTILPLFYSFADLLVHPSLFEGFGITPLEAMACGTPVIASNRGSLPEVIGDAGIYFDPLDDEALSRLILKVLRSREMLSELREKGFRQVEKFSWAKTAEGILRSCERAFEVRQR